MKRNGIIGGICIAVVLLLFVATDPADMPSFVLVLPFLLLFTALVLFFVSLFRRRGMASRRSWRIALLCASVPLALLVLQSIGQLTVRDVLTIMALFVLSYFYVSRVTAPTK